MKIAAASLIMAMILLALLSVACGEALQGERMVFVSSVDGSSDIYAMNADGSAITQLTNHNADDWQPDLSPDGRRIAFISNRDGNTEIYKVNLDNSDAARLTNNDAGDWNPVWSPDGQRIAFISNRDGGPPDISHMPRINDEIYAMNADGTDITRLTDNDFEDESPTWSPDSQRIAFVSERDGNKDIYAMNADGAGITRLTSNDDDDYAPAWSHDGRRIAFSASPPSPHPHEYGNPEIYVMNADGTERTRLYWGINPVWSPDGRRIAFSRPRGYYRIMGNMEIYVMIAGGAGNPVEVTQLTDNDADDWMMAWESAP